jgi:hypothetical protein
VVVSPLVDWSSAEVWASSGVCFLKIPTSTNALSSAKYCQIFPTTPLADYSDTAYTPIHPYSLLSPPLVASEQPRGSWLEAETAGHTGRDAYDGDHRQAKLSYSSLDRDFEVVGVI